MSHCALPTPFEHKHRPSGERLSANGPLIKKISYLKIHLHLSKNILLEKSTKKIYSYRYTFGFTGIQETNIFLVWPYKFSYCEHQSSFFLAWLLKIGISIDFEMNFTSGPISAASGQQIIGSSEMHNTTDHPLSWITNFVGQMMCLRQQ